jgi:hypothetical protein
MVCLYFWTKCNAHDFDKVANKRNTLSRSLRHSGIVYCFWKDLEISRFSLHMKAIGMSAQHLLNDIETFGFHDMGLFDSISKSVCVVRHINSMQHQCHGYLTLLMSSPLLTTYPPAISSKWSPLGFVCSAALDPTWLTPVQTGGSFQISAC